jgi:molybdopterin-guanine dinucleotide biosynthesis protein A
VLAGGAARRLGGVSKPDELVGGRSMLARVVAAVGSAEPLVVVGPRRDDVAPRAVWRREEPPGGGPVAAIAAGLPEVDAPTTLVLAADLPFVAPAVPALLDALAGGDAEVALLTVGGRANYLAAAWRTRALRARLERLGDPAGRSMRALHEGVAAVEVPDPGRWGEDCDTWAELDAARRRAEEAEEMA